MAKITTEQVKELRDLTSVSIMQCRKALEEADGDTEKAMIILRKKGSEIAEKKSDRNTNDGLVKVKNDDKRAVALILNCETDFVAKNDDFKKLAENIAESAWKNGVNVAKDESVNLINDVVLKIGENIQLGTLEEISGDVIGSYTHHTGKTASVVVLKGGNAEIAKDIAMHVAAMRPVYTRKEDIRTEDREQVMEALRNEMNSIDKPEDMKQKIMEGKILSYFKDQTLNEQSFFKIPEKTVAEYASSHGAVIEKFVLYTIGA